MRLLIGRFLARTCMVRRQSPVSADVGATTPPSIRSLPRFRPQPQLAPKSASGPTTLALFTFSRRPFFHRASEQPPAGRPNPTLALTMSGDVETQRRREKQIGVEEKGKEGGEKPFSSGINPLEKKNVPVRYEQKGPIQSCNADSNGLWCYMQMQPRSELISSLSSLSDSVMGPFPSVRREERGSQDDSQDDRQDDRAPRDEKQMKAKLPLSFEMSP